jgi:uncharacterized protein YyaL (SSP411 family)
MIRAALALHETRNWAPAFVPARDYLADAIAWAEALETYHADPESGLLNMAAKDAGDVILRLAPTSDDAIPNAHPVYLSALVRLFGLTGDARWLEIGVRSNGTPRIPADCGRRVANPRGTGLRRNSTSSRAAR